MDLNKLKAEFPEESAALIAEGTKAEQSRREKIVAFRGINAEGDKAVEDAIASGKAYEDVSPSIQAAIARGNSPKAQADGENPPDLKTKTQENVAGAVAITDDDIQAAKTAHRAIHRGLDLLPARHVAFHRLGSAARPANAVRRGDAGCVIDVSDDHPASPFRQKLRGRFPDPRSPAGHQTDFTRKLHIGPRVRRTPQQSLTDNLDSDFRQRKPGTEC